MLKTGTRVKCGQKANACSDADVSLTSPVDSMTAKARERLVALEHAQKEKNKRVSTTNRLRKLRRLWTAEVNKDASWAAKIAVECSENEEPVHPFVSGDP